MYTKTHPVTGFTHLGDVIQRPPWLQRWESLRHGSFHWLVECIGEAMGVYFYVYCGTGANAVFTIANLTDKVGLGAMQTVALGYAFGIVMAVSCAGPASGGHFNPAITISQAIWRGFPWSKVPRFIIAQILGAYLACLAVYSQYRSTFQLLEEGLIASGQYDTVQFTPNGIAGIFGLFTQNGANLHNVFMNEFFTSLYLALVIWGVLDPTNFFVPPANAPWVIGLAYGTAIWAFGPGALSANTARDLGGRLMALTIWGKAASGGHYAAISALGNIPATLLATLIYEVVLVDSSRVLPRAHKEFLNGHKAHLDHKVLAPEPHKITTSNHSSTDKGGFFGVEHGHVA